MNIRRMLGMTAVTMAVVAVAYAGPPQKYPWTHVSDWAAGHDAQTQLMLLTCGAIAGHLEDHFDRDAIQANYLTAVACGFVN